MPGRSKETRKGSSLEDHQCFRTQSSSFRVSGHTGSVYDTYNKVPRHGDSQNNAVDANYLEEGQPGVRFASVSVLYSWYLNHCCDYRNAQVREIAFAFEKMSPVDCETYENLPKKDHSDHGLRGIDEGFSGVAHVGTSQHLADKAVGYDSDPYPRCVVIQTFQCANTWTLLLFVLIFFVDIFSRKGTRLALFTNDLERRGNDCN